MSPSSLPDLPCELHRLDNGLRVVLHRDATVPLVAINVWYHVGSKNESPGRTGFAHLFEHMLFQGSAHVGTNDHFRYVQQVGGVANGSTWYDRTNYYETLPAHHLELGLWLESDRMGFLLPAMTAEKLENQRDVVLNERRQRVDNQPYGRALERLHELLYPPAHPYRHPVIGYPEDIAAASLDDVRAFFATYYAPNNAVLSLAGDFAPDAARELVERWFGPIPSGPPVPPVVVPAPDGGGPRREVLADRVELPRLYLGFRAPAYGAGEWYAGSLLALALAGGKSSPLYQDLVYRRQLAQDVGVFLYPTELESTLIVVATARPDVEPERLAAALDEHLARAAAEPPAPADLERARNRVLTVTYDELETVDRKADLLSQYTTVFDDPRRLRQELRAYLETPPDALRAFAAAHLGADRAAVTVVPREERG